MKQKRPEIPEFSDLINYAEKNGYEDALIQPIVNFYLPKEEDYYDIYGAFEEYFDLKKSGKIPKEKQNFVNGMDKLKKKYDEIVNNIDNTIKGDIIWRETCVENADSFEDDIIKYGKGRFGNIKNSTDEDETDGNGIVIKDIKLQKGYEKKFGFDGVGIFWSWDKNNAVALNNVGGKQCVRMAAKVIDGNNIDVAETIISNITFENQEKEIRLFKGSNLKLLQMCRSRLNPGTKQERWIKDNDALSNCIVQKTAIKKINNKNNRYFKNDQIIIT